MTRSTSTETPIQRAKRIGREHGDEIVSRYAAGETMPELGAAFRVSRSTIRLILKRVDAPIRKRGFGGMNIKGDRNPYWRGGRYVHNGYVYRWIPPDHSFAAMRRSKGYVLEHRLVMAAELGRPLLPSETVHHIDGNGENNTPSNLQLRNGQHGKGVCLRCFDCGSENVGPSPI